MWVLCRIFGSWFGPALGSNPIRNRRLPAGSLQVFGALFTQPRNCSVGRFRGRPRLKPSLLQVLSLLVRCCLSGDLWVADRRSGNVRGRRASVACPAVATSASSDASRMLCVSVAPLGRSCHAGRTRSPVACDSAKLKGSGTDVCGCPESGPQA